MSSREQLGGIIHTYQKYDPVSFPSPTAPPPDLVSPAFEHLLEYGDMREFTEEELVRAVRLDISQIAGLGPSLESLRRMLEERKRKILETYETEKVSKQATHEYQSRARRMTPPPKQKENFRKSVQEEQIRELERLWYRLGDERSPFAQQLVQLIDDLSNKYQIDELTGKYEFTGNKSLSIDEALEVKQELETIDRLLEQIKQAQETSQLAIIDLEEMSQFASPEQMQELDRIQQQVQELIRQMAESQGLEKNQRGFQLTPQAYKLFQGKLLQEIFSNLQPSRSGRHQGPIVGEGAVEMARTKEFEFGDSPANMDIVATFTNALLRDGPSLPVRMRQEDIVIHRTRNSPKCATVVAMDMSGSMRYGGLYVNVKRMGLALDGLIRREYPGDYLQFIEMATFAKPKRSSELVKLLPKPVTVFDPIVRFKADMSNPDISETHIPPHFTNIQHALQQARQFLATQDTPNRQIILITDGLPTAHFEGSDLYMLYPPDPRTEEATMREGALCRREGIVLNLFLLSSWSQTVEDVRFAHRLAESTQGRVFFTGGKELDRYVVWDYIQRKKQILG